MLAGVNRQELCHDRHTVSLLADHMVFSPKYRGKVLVGEVAIVAEAIIRKTCKEPPRHVKSLSYSHRPPIGINPTDICGKTQRIVGIKKKNIV